MSDTGPLSPDDIDLGNSHDYDALVTEGAMWVDRGLAALDALDIPEDIREDAPTPPSSDAFRAHVREYLETVAASEDDPDEDDARVATPTADPTAIDWPALWREYDFDADGCYSRTQLALAVSVSEQTPGISEATAAEIVRAAADQQALATVMARDEDGADIVRGYRLIGNIDGGDGR